MNRKIIITSILSCLQVFLFYAVVMAEVTATVDRSRLALGETCTVTITKDGSSFFAKPDLAPLEKDFRILSQGQSSSTRISNGDVSTSVSWNITLKPLRSGVLTIDPIRIGKETTAPLRITVSKESRPPASMDNEAVFVETEVDAPKVFVQGQVIFTLRVYVAIEAQLQASELQIEDAVIETLDASQYTKTVKGRSYHVVEQKYAIFPQKSGTLEIPSLTVRATLPQQQQRFNDFFDPFGSLLTPGKSMTLRSQGKTVEVLEKSKEYPGNAVWLPTEKLDIAEEWSSKPEDLQVGESVTVNIKLEAEGLPASQLPPITLPEQEGLKLYQSKAEVENRAHGSGITGVRREAIALIPTRPGTIQLGEIRIPWWNKKKGTVEYAVLPAKELHISGAAEQAKPAPPGEAARKTAVTAPTPVQAAPVSRPTGWIILTVLLAGAWLTTIYLLMSTRRQVKLLAPPPAGVAEAGVREQREKEAFQALRQTCRTNDIKKVRAAVINWAGAFCPEAGIRTFADIEHARIGPELAPLLREIDALLYSAEPGGVAWQGGRILETVSAIREKRSQSRGDNEILQPLYK